MQKHEGENQVTQRSASHPRVLQDAQRSTSICLHYNQLGGTTVPELPYGLLRLHMHEGLNSICRKQEPGLLLV